MSNPIKTWPSIAQLVSLSTATEYSSLRVLFTVAIVRAEANLCISVSDLFSFYTDPDPALK